jgi:transcriptional regulator GlxA family with amidase domain
MLGSDARPDGTPDAFVGILRFDILDGLRATRNTSALWAMRRECPGLEVVDAKVVDEGVILTASGVSSGIDLVLHFHERGFGPEVRARAARVLEGPWR